MESANWELKDCVWKNLSDFGEIRIIISKFESCLIHFFKICTDLEVSYGDQATEFGFHVENVKLISSLRDKISSSKSRITESRSENEYLEKLRLEKEEQEQKLADEIRTSQLENEERARVNDLMVCAHNLHFEIKTRYETLGGGGMFS